MGSNEDGFGVMKMQLAQVSAWNGGGTVGTNGTRQAYNQGINHTWHHYFVFQNGDIWQFFFFLVFPS